MPCQECGAIMGECFCPVNSREADARAGDGELRAAAREVLALADSTIPGWREAEPGHDAPVWRALQRLDRAVRI